MADLEQKDIKELIDALNQLLNYKASRQLGDLNKLYQWTTDYNHILTLVKAHLIILDEPTSELLDENINILLTVLRGEREHLGLNVLDRLNNNSKGEFKNILTTQDLIKHSRLVVANRR